MIDSTDPLACMFDAVRCYKLAEDREIGGVLLLRTKYSEARAKLEGFMVGKREQVGYRTALSRLPGNIQIAGTIIGPGVLSTSGRTGYVNRN